MNPLLDAIDSQRIRRAIQKMPASVQADFPADGQINFLDEPYYSKFRVSAATVASGLVTMQIQTRTCFNYAIGESMVNAGYPAGYNATIADTNLQARSETNASQYVCIDGVVLMPMPRSDPALLEQIWSDLHVSGAAEGRPGFYRFGPPVLLGGGGGLHGGGVSRLYTPDIGEKQMRHPGFVNNGLPSVGDWNQKPDPIIWCPKGKPDSTFGMQIDLLRQRTFQATARTLDAANGITAFTVPADQTAESDVQGTFVEFMAVLKCVQIQGRSANR